jgi:MshEN domain
MALTLLEMLSEAGLITRDQFDEALLNRVIYGGKIGTSLIELDLIEEETLARFLSKKLLVPYVHPDQLADIPDDVIKLVPRGLALKYKVVPLKLEKKRLSLAMADPSDLRAVDEIAFITDFIVKPLIAPELRLIEALKNFYGYEINERYQHILEKMSDWQVSAAEAVEAQRAHEELIDESKLDEAVLVENEAPVDPYSMASISEALANAFTREQIGEILLGYLGEIFDRGALFVVRGDAVFGWRAIKGKQELKNFSHFSLRLADSSVVKTVVEGRSPYLGGISNRGADAELIRGLGGDPPGTTLLLPLQLAGRVVNVIYVDGGETHLGERMSELNRLIRKTTLAFEILIRREKILLS